MWPGASHARPAVQPLAAGPLPAQRARPPGRQRAGRRVRRGSAGAVGGHWRAAQRRRATASVAWLTLHKTSCAAIGGGPSAGAARTPPWPPACLAARQARRCGGCRRPLARRPAPPRHCQRGLGHLTQAQQRSHWRRALCRRSARAPLAASAPGGASGAALRGLFAANAAPPSAAVPLSAWTRSPHASPAAQLLAAATLPCQLCCLQSCRAADTKRGTLWSQPFFSTQVGRR